MKLESNPGADASLHPVFGKILNMVAIPVCVIATEDKNKIVLCNDAFSSRIVSEKMVRGCAFVEEIVEYDDQKIFEAALSRFINKEDCTGEVEVRTLTRNGRDNNFPLYRTYRWTMKWISENRVVLSGENVYLAPSSTASTTDVVDEKNMANDHDELIDFFQNAPIAMHWLSGTGHVIWANNTELKTLGYDADEYIGHHIMEFCPEEGEALQSVFTKLSKGLTIHNEPFKFRTKAGAAKYLTVDSNVKFNVDGSFRHTRCFIKDDTERRIKETIADIDRRAKETIALEKERLIHRVFHEIRTPLHATMFELETAVASQMPVSHKSLVTMQKQLDGVHGFVEDLSFLFMFESNNVIKNKADPVNLSLLISDIFECVKVADVRAGQNVKFVVDMSDVPASVMASPCLRRVLFNLCRNGVRFSPDETTITISVQYSPIVPDEEKSLKSASRARKFRSLVNASDNEESGNFAFKVVNTANKPIDIVEVHTCFHNCYRATAAETQKNALISQQGVGLGLYVCYNMVQSMGGSLGCSGNSAATTFWFTVPLKINKAPIPPTPRIATALGMQTIAVEWAAIAKSALSSLHIVNDAIPDVGSSGSDDATTISASAHTSNPASSEYSSVSGTCTPMVLEREVRILVVDDSSICQKVLCETLKKQDFIVSTKSNGQEALDELADHPDKYDVIVLDILMPIMDGIETLYNIRGALGLTGIPVIILSAEGDSCCEEALEAGANAVLTKPARSDEIINAITSFL